jgi:hypothetical protein
MEEKPKFITAIIFETKFGMYWGFNFNTDVQEFIENAMLSMCYSASDYFLKYTEEAPEGVYTKVKVIVRDNKMIKFEIK